MDTKLIDSGPAGSFHVPAVVGCYLNCFGRHDLFLVRHDRESTLLLYMIIILIGSTSVDARST